MKIGVLNIYSFPVGLAPTTRILAYCKGLVEVGNECEIVTFLPKDRSFGMGPLSGTISGCNYYQFAYSPEHNGANRIRLLRSLRYRALNLKCEVLAIRHIIHSHRARKYDYMILSFDKLAHLTLFVPALCMMGIKIVSIADEYPRPIRDKMKASVPRIRLLFYKIVSAGIQKRILMTKNLQCFYDEKISTKPTLILSTIVDTDRFMDVENGLVADNYICYMGNMALSKDNVDNIIKAFSQVVSSFPDLSLRLYGMPSVSDETKLKQIIHELDLGDRVSLCGRVDHSLVPYILSRAKILVTSQPKTKRAEGGFPTKLGEYFMSGVPSVVTNVGEIGIYAHDKENCYLVEPENPVEYANVLNEILSNYDSAKIVAQNAREYILSNFSCLAAGHAIDDFLRTNVNQ